MADEYQRRLDAYRNASAEADAARDAWNKFLPTQPLGAAAPPLLLGNAMAAYDTLKLAEEKEHDARTALFELLTANSKDLTGR